MRNRGGIAEKGPSLTSQAATLLVLCSGSSLSVTCPPNKALVKAVIRPRPQSPCGSLGTLCRAVLMGDCSLN